MKLALQGKPGIWNVPDLIEKNPLGADAVKRIFLVEAPLTSVNVVQVKDEIEPHIHKEHDEIVYFLSAGGRFRLGREEIAIRAGDLFYIPAGLPHGGRVGEGKLISIYSPYYDPKNPDRIPVQD